jgi:hypothetical protein
VWALATVALVGCVDAPTYENGTNNDVKHAALSACP